MVARVRCQEITDGNTLAARRGYLLRPILAPRYFSSASLSSFVFIRVFDGTRSSTILEIFFFFFLKLVYRENLPSFFFEKFVEKGKNFEFQGEIKSICDVR